MATTITKTEPLVGKAIRRKEDPRLITGMATCVDDIEMPGMHHACIVQSPHAAAKINSVDTKAALECPGVVANWNAGEQSVTLHTSTQIPHPVRSQVAAMLGIGENLMRVIAPEVGGGFGSKLNVYAEEALISFIGREECQ